MDIYAYAETGVLADYYDQSTGYIYHVAAYNRARSFGLPTLGIGVTDLATGQFIGYARRVEELGQANPEKDSERSAETKGDVTNIFVLESGIYFAPEHIQKWFEKNPEFRISCVGPKGISFAPVYSEDHSEWLTVDGIVDSNPSKFWTALQCNKDRSKFPDFVVVRCLGGNANSSNGGYSICCWKTRAEKKNIA